MSPSPQVSLAYECLRDAAKRVSYDRTYAHVRMQWDTYRRGVKKDRKHQGHQKAQREQRASSNTEAHGRPADYSSRVFAEAMRQFQENLRRRSKEAEQRREKYQREAEERQRRFEQKLDEVVRSFDEAREERQQKHEGEVEAKMRMFNAYKHKPDGYVEEEPHPPQGRAQDEKEDPLRKEHGREQAETQRPTQAAAEDAAQHQASPSGERLQEAHRAEKMRLDNLDRLREQVEQEQQRLREKDDPFLGATSYATPRPTHTQLVRRIKREAASSVRLWATQSQRTGKMPDLSLPQVRRRSLRCGNFLRVLEGLVVSPRLRDDAELNDLLETVLDNHSHFPSTLKLRARVLLEKWKIINWGANSAGRFGI